MLKEYFEGIWNDRYILWSLVNNDLRMKYRKSKLGVMWAILMPLGLSIIIGAVYSVVFVTDPKEFIPLIFAGLNPWLFMTGTADGGTFSFISAEGYLKQTNVNAQIFPLRTALVNFINLLYAIMAFIAVYMVLQPMKFGAEMLMVIPGLFIMFVFSLGLGNITASVNLVIRDFQPLQSLIFQGLFYATPIIFPASKLEEQGFEILYQLNPFYYMLEIVKTPIQGNLVEDFRIYLIAIVITVLVFLTSVVVVMKIKKGIALKL